MWVYISPGLSGETSTGWPPGRSPPTSARRRSKREPGRDVALHADDRLDPGGPGLLVEVVRAEDVAVVGHRERRHAHAGGLGHEVGQPRGAVEHGVLGVHVEVHEPAAPDTDADRLPVVACTAGRSRPGSSHGSTLRPRDSNRRHRRSRPDAPSVGADLRPTRRPTRRSSWLRSCPRGGCRGSVADCGRSLVVKSKSAGDEREGAGLGSLSANPYPHLVCDRYFARFPCASRGLRTVAKHGKPS